MFGGADLAVSLQSSSINSSQDGTATVSQAKGTITFPAQFILIAAMNPCPCGYFGTGMRKCKCTPRQIERYMAKISGPLLDRIDIHLDVLRVPYQKLTALESSERSAAIRARIEAARVRQQERFARQD
ncbi:hypothetical protein LCGC14_2435820, partial [marine sediment metagenome]